MDYTTPIVFGAYNVKNESTFAENQRLFQHNQMMNSTLVNRRSLVLDKHELVKRESTLINPDGHVECDSDEECDTESVVSKVSPDE